MFNRMKGIGWSLLLLVIFSSCQKGELVETYKNFVNVSFDASQTALAKNGGGLAISAKYNGYPIPYDINLKKIKVVEGEGKFEFLDASTGELLIEKTVDVKLDGDNQFYMFQPSLGSPVTFYDPTAQDNEAAAPEGHIKLKLANYAQDIIPFNKLDVKFFITYYDADWNQVVKELAFIRDISNSVNEGEYHIIPDGLSEEIMDYVYSFEFYNGETGEPLLNHGGTTYFGDGFMPAYLTPLPEKKVFTVYLTSFKAWGETPVFIKKGEDFYTISGNVLFAN